MANESLRSRALAAFSWSFLGYAGLNGVRFVMGIVLARLLMPEQFGLIGMVMVFISVAAVFLDGGFCAALIQKKDATVTDLSSVFYLNVSIGLVTGVLFYLAAPLIAAFYDKPVLTPLTRALSLIPLINSIGLVPNAILSRNINFKAETKISFIASVLSSIVGIILALSGFGVWSLVFQQISSAFAYVLFLWLLTSWRPMLVFSWQSLRSMFSFGSRLMGTALLSVAFDNLYALIIGKLFSERELGLFTRANNFQSTPVSALGKLTEKVLFPVFSNLQDDLARMKSWTRKVVKIAAFVQFPMMAGLAAASRPIVLVALGEKWAGSIQYLQLLCFVGILYPIEIINANIFLSLGKSRLFLWMRIVKTVLIVINVGITWHYGIRAMIIGMIAAEFITFLFSCYLTDRQLGYKIINQSKDLLPYLGLSALMGIFVYSANFLPFRNPLFVLLVQIAIGCTLYFGLCRLFRLDGLMELWDMRLGANNPRLGIRRS